MKKKAKVATPHPASALIARRMQDSLKGRRFVFFFFFFFIGKGFREHGVLCRTISQREREEKEGVVSASRGASKERGKGMKSTSV